MNLSEQREKGAVKQYRKKIRKGQRGKSDIGEKSNRQKSEAGRAKKLARD